MGFFMHPVFRQTLESITREMEGIFMKAVRFCLVVCFALLFASCSLKPAWDVAGNWENMDGKETLSFSRNGTVTLTNGLSTINTTFKFTDSKNLKLDMGSLGTFDMEAHVAKDILTLTGPDGKISKYRKAK